MGEYVETYAFPDGRLELRWKGVSLPYRSVDKDQQRATHAAVADNKRLNEMLAFAMELQKTLPPKLKRVCKQQTRYEPVKRVRAPRRTWIDAYAERRATEFAALPVDKQPPA